MAWPLVREVSEAITISVSYPASAGKASRGTVKPVPPMWEVRVSSEVTVLVTTWNREPRKSGKANRQTHFVAALRIMARRRHQFRNALFTETRTHFSARCFVQAHLRSAPSSVSGSSPRSLRRAPRFGPARDIPREARDPGLPTRSSLHRKNKTLRSKSAREGRCLSTFRHRVMQCRSHEPRRRALMADRHPNASPDLFPRTASLVSPFSRHPAFAKGRAITPAAHPRQEDGPAGASGIGPGGNAQPP